MTQFGFLKNFDKKGKIVKLDFFYVCHSRFDIFQNSCKENRKRSGKDLRHFLKTCHDAIWFFENFSKSSFLIFRVFHLLPPRIEKTGQLEGWVLKCFASFGLRYKSGGATPCAKI
jgi:hypothetical protein